MPPPKLNPSEQKILVAILLFLLSGEYLFPWLQWQNLFPPILYSQIAFLSILLPWSWTLQYQNSSQQTHRQPINSILWKYNLYFAAFLPLLLAFRFTAPREIAWQDLLLLYGLWLPMTLGLKLFSQTFPPHLFLLFCLLLSSLPVYIQFLLSLFFPNTLNWLYALSPFGAGYAYLYQPTHLKPFFFSWLLLMPLARLGNAQNQRRALGIASSMKANSQQPR